MSYACDFCFIAFARHCREHADVLTYVAPSHVVILSRLRSRGGRGSYSRGGDGGQEVGEMRREESRREMRE